MAKIYQVYKGNKEIIKDLKENYNLRIRQCSNYNLLDMLNEYVYFQNYNFTQIYCYSFLDLIIDNKTKEKKEIDTFFEKFFDLNNPYLNILYNEKDNNEKLRYYLNKYNIKNIEVNFEDLDSNIKYLKTFKSFLKYEN